jgi:hypothetical protein
VTATTYAAGRRRWIEARAAALAKLRGFSAGAALAKAKAEFAYFADLDRKRKEPPWN